MMSVYESLQTLNEIYNVEGEQREMHKKRKEGVLLIVVIIKKIFILGKIGKVRTEGEGEVVQVERKKWWCIYTHLGKG